MSQLASVLRVASGRRRFAAHEWWGRDRIAEYQRERLGWLVEHASRRSAFYAKLYGGPVDRSRVVLEQLPPVTKATTMASFDTWATDPRVRLADLEAHLAAIREDVLYLGEYRVMATGGSSGLKGIFVYNRAEWRAVLAGVMRWTGMMGVTPRLRRRVRTASIGAPAPSHMTYRIAASLDVGLFATLRLSATQPIDELVEALNRHLPEAINAYPSIMALLACEQLAGRLRISPRTISTSSEMRTDEMTERIREAWGIEPYNSLGLTETGVAGADCEHHQGLHVFEDQCIYEVVDEHDRPVPPGERGAKVLVTNLFNYTQPIIRFEISDLVTVSDAACACGRTLRRITEIDGRSDDILTLPARTGGVVDVHPIHVRKTLVSEPEVAQYQVIQLPDRLDIKIELARGAEPHAVIERIKAGLAGQLASVGAAPIEAHVRAVEHIERDPGAGKLKLIRALR